MSHKLSVGLVDDNVVFYNLVTGKEYIPKEVFNKFSFKISYILGAAYLNLKNYQKGLKYLSKSILLDPKSFISNIFQKIV